MAKKFDFSDKSVLIVEPAHFFRSMVSNLCRSFGFREVHEVQTGPDGLDILAQCEVDVVITEARMAPIDGFEFIEFIRKAADSTNREVHVILLTGYSTMRSVLRARDAGATEFLTKPISAETLLVRLASVFETPREFIKTRRFTGPDRRRRSQNTWDGSDRRQGADGPSLSATANAETAAAAGDRAPHADEANSATMAPVPEGRTTGGEVA